MKSITSLYIQPLTDQRCHHPLHDATSHTASSGLSTSSIIACDMNARLTQMVRLLPSLVVNRKGSNVRTMGCLAWGRIDGGVRQRERNVLSVVGTRILYDTKEPEATSSFLFRTATTAQKSEPTLFSPPATYPCELAKQYHN